MLVQKDMQTREMSCREKKTGGEVLLVERKGLGRSIQERGLVGREKGTGEMYTGERSLVERKGLGRSI